MSTQRSKKWRKQNLQKSRDYQKEWKRKQRLKIIEHYSHGTMVCAKCGIADIRVLTIDHIHGGGKAQLKEAHTNLPQWIINNKYPEGMFQVLCQNCQFIKASDNNEWGTKRRTKK